jgi:4-amino-4-deoxy-L-arabinose transferase-like glycosyltransferase
MEDQATSVAVARGAVVSASRRRSCLADRNEHRRAETHRSPYCYPWRWPLFAPLLLLAVVAGATFFCRLDCPLLEPEETRYAEIPRQMLAEGSFAVPLLHHQPYYQKPPLLYWLVIGCYALFGTHDWAARLVPAAAGALTVLLVFLGGRPALGRRAALLAALLLCLSPRFLYLERMLGMDGLLCLWVTAALLAGAAAMAGPGLRWRWWLVSALAAGLGLLTKGPVALALVVPPLATFPLLAPAGCRPSLRAWLAYVALAPALAAPWYVGMAMHDPRAAADFFWLHNVVRYVSPFDHVQPWWYYLPGLLAFVLPWSLLLILPFGRGLAGRLRPAWRSLALRWPSPALVRVKTQQRRRPPALRLCLLASLWCLAFFSAAGCKRPSYVLPALPQLALVLGWHVDGVLSRRQTISRRLAEAACGLLLFALVLTWEWVWLPAHHRAYSLREQVECGRAACPGPDIPVACYPHCWDSVAFYLGRQDVRVYESAQVADLVAAVQAQPQMLLFVKREGFLATLKRSLPLGLELVECGPPGGAAVACRVRFQGGS